MLSKWEWIELACWHKGAYLASYYAARIEQALRELYRETITSSWKFEVAEGMHDDPEKAEISEIMDECDRVLTCIACIESEKFREVRGLYKGCLECKFGIKYGNCITKGSLYNKFEDEIKRFQEIDKKLRAKEDEGKSA